MLTHGNMIANTLTALAERDYCSSDRYLHVAPLYHCADLELFYGMTYACGGNVVLREFRPEAVLEVIERERVSVTFMVPAMINFLLEHEDFERRDLSSLRLVVYGGSAIPIDRLRAALERLPCKLSQGYGLTETSPILCILPAEDHVTSGPGLRRIASAGRPAHGVEVRIFDEQDRECPVEVVGEIVARGKNIMKGYWRLPDETERALRGGWFHTGDMGYRDADGYIYIVDRKKDMIVTGGENVYPREVEEVLYEHPGVLEAAVIGVPSGRWGETVKAVVAAREGHDPSGEALIAYCRERLAHYKCPSSVDFVVALPRNPSGKVLKRELRERYWAGHDRRVS
jgi:long-chain acyl-CoA synthetase